jgi:RHS repeat-associated protein
LAYAGAITPGTVCCSGVAGVSYLTNLDEIANLDVDGDAASDLMLPVVGIGQQTIYQSFHPYLEKIEIFSDFNDAGSLSQWNNSSLINHSSAFKYIPQYNQAKNTLLKIGNFDGNGKSDVYYVLHNDVGDHQAFVTLDGGSNASAQQIEVQMNLTTKDVMFGEQVMVIDFDGDGDNEIFSISSTGEIMVVDLEISENAGVYSCLATLVYQTSNEFPSFDGNSPNDLMYSYDFNNDRISDFLVSTDAGFTWDVFTGRGNDLQNYAGGSYPSTALPNYVALGSYGPFPGNNIIDEKELQFGDFDGDGYVDVLTRYNNQFWFASNNGTDQYYNVLSQSGTHTSQSGVSSMVGDFDGDGVAEILTNEDGGDFKRIIEFNYEFGFDLVQEVEDGFGNFTKFQYKTLSKALSSNNPEYSMTGGLSFPFVEIAGGKPIVVKKIINATATEASLSEIVENYSYEQFTLDIHGSGMVNFKSRSISNNYNSLKTEVYNAFNYSYHYSYPWKWTTRATNSAVYQNTQCTTDLIFEKIQLYQINSTITSGLTFLSLPTTTTAYDYLNATKSRSVNTWQIGNGYTLLENAQYDGEPLLSNNALFTETVVYEGFASGCNGFETLPEFKTITSTRTGESPVSVSSLVTYNGNGKIETKETNGVTSTLSYNQFGSINTVQISAVGLPTLTSSTSYGYDGRFAVNSVNAIGQTAPQQAVYDERFGLATTTVGLSGLQEFTSYNDLGRAETSTDIYGNVTSVSYEWVLNYGNGTSILTPDNAIFKKIITSPTGYEKTEYFDRQGNLRFTEDNDGVKTATAYTLNGFIDKQTFPFKDVNQIVYEQYDYDEFGRVTQHIESNGGVSTSYSYSSPSVGVTKVDFTSSLGNRAMWRDANNLVTKVVDAGGELTFSYNSFNKVRAIFLDNVIVSKITYDNKGRRISLTEPSSGTTTYEYDAYSQLISQTTAGNGNKEWFVYDNLGRKIETWKNNNTIKANEVTFSASGPSINQVEQVVNNQMGLVQYSYNNFGDVTTIDYPNDGVSCQYSYDNFGRVYKKDFNNGMQKILYTYNTTGNLSSILTKAFNETSYTTLTTVNERNANNNVTKRLDPFGQTVFSSYNDHGRLTKTELPSVLDFQYQWNNSTGNLTQRSDQNNSLYELFYYDNLNRLTDVYLGATLVSQYTYDNRGNFTSKEDVGAFEYSVLNKNTFVENISGEINTTSGQIRDFTTENELSYLSEDGFELFIENHADNHTRKQSRTTYNTADIEIREYYPEIGFEKFSNVLTNITYNLFYQQAGGEIVSMIVKESDINSPNSYNTPPNEGYYGVISDHLGSISLVYDQNGVVAKQSFDAWGKRRNPDTWTNSTGSLINPEWLTRGFTGHEQLDYFNLIHMNGRIYSPLEGRMISPDNYVQSPFSSYSYNRYSYCFNNPLKYSDPDGEWVHIAIGAVLGGAINLGVQWYKHSSTGQDFSFTDGAVAFGIGAAAGGIGAATGGAAFAWAGGGAAGAGGFAAGFVGGVGGAMFATPIQSVGNQAYFGDPGLTPGQYGMSMLFSGLTGGLMNGISAKINGNNFITGNRPGMIPESARIKPIPPPNRDLKGSVEVDECIMTKGHDPDIPLEKAQLIIWSERLNKWVPLNEAGKAAEEAVFRGTPPAKVRIPSLTNSATYRIPDGYNKTSKVLIEVKDVQYLRYTKQLEDFYLHTLEEGMRFELYTRPNTQLSKELEKMTLDALIIHKFIPEMPVIAP